MKMVMFPCITCSWHNVSKPNLAIVCLSWNVLGLELLKNNNDGMRTMNFGQRMSFSCSYGNGGKHKTGKEKHVCQKKSVNTFENSCAQNATIESHKFWMNFLPWTARIRRSVIQSGSKNKSKKKPQPEEFANYLGDVFRSDVGHNASVLDMLKRTGPTAFRLSSFVSCNMCWAKCHAIKQQMLLESWSKCSNMEKLYCAHVCWTC